MRQQESPVYVDTQHPKQTPTVHEEAHKQVETQRASAKALAKIYFFLTILV